MENKILAVVNGREITEADLNSAISKFPRERQEALLTEKGRARLLEQIISFELIHDESVENGLEADAEYLSELEMMKRELLTQVAIKKLLSNVKVEEDEVKAYYDANEKLFTEPEKVTANHILVETEEEAKKVKDEFQAGETFGNLAMKYSTCPSNTKGGSLGSFVRGQMVPEFEAAAFSQEIGVVGDPVKTQFGYHLIQVENKSDPSIRAYEEVSAQILSRLTQERQNMTYTKHTEELKEKYGVEIKA